MKHIYIAAPANRFTGGPTLAHQLCKELINQGHEAKMYYYRYKKNQPAVHAGYEKFNIPFVTALPKDDENTLIVVPETAPDILKHYSKAKKVIWWMSVDNYFDKYLQSKRNKILNVGGLLKYDVFSSKNYHLAQSQYAIDFLLSKNINKENIFYLSDYVDDIFLENEWSPENRKKQVVYSPKRGFEFTKAIMDELSDVSFIPLQNMSQSEMIQVMNQSMLYIDFGNHPGKDRIPREAALCGCCIITGKEGSAKNSVDVSIPEKYKFEAPLEEVSKISNTIREILLNYSTEINNFESYRNKILKEKGEFAIDVEKIFTSLCK